MKFRAQQIALWTGAAVLSCTLVRAGEQVQFKGSTSVELPKPKRPLDENRKMRMDPERPNLEGGFVAPPADNSSPASTKKLREALDKKKNWIFMDPHEQQFDSKTEEFMQGEKSTGLYDNKWMSSKEEKTLVQKFIEEKNNRSRDKERMENDDLPERSNSEREGLLSDDPVSSDRDKDENLPLGGLKMDLGDKMSAPGGSTFSETFRSGPPDKGFQKNLLNENPFTARKSLPGGIEKEEIKQQQIAHEREFDSILQNRLGSGGGPAVGRLDSLNLGSDMGRLDAGSTGNRPGGGDSFLRMGRGVSSAPSTVNFTDGGSGFGARPTFDSRSIGDSFGSSAKIAPSFAPTVPQAPVIQRNSGAPAPFSLPFPQRKF